MSLLETFQTIRRRSARDAASRKNVSACDVSHAACLVTKQKDRQRHEERHGARSQRCSSHPQSAAVARLADAKLPAGRHGLTGTPSSISFSLHMPSSSIASGPSYMYYRQTLTDTTCGRISEDQTSNKPDPANQPQRSPVLHESGDTRSLPTGPAVYPSFFYRRTHLPNNEL